MKLNQSLLITLVISSGCCCWMWFSLSVSGAFLQMLPECGRFVTGQNTEDFAYCVAGVEDINAISKDGQQTLFQLVGRTGRFDLLPYIARPDLDLNVNDQGSTVLSALIREKRYESMGDLLKPMKDYYRKRDRPDEEMFYAIELKDKRAIKILLENGFTLDSPDYFGQRPIEYASKDFRPCLESLRRTPKPDGAFRKKKG